VGKSEGTNEDLLEELVLINWNSLNPLGWVTGHMLKCSLFLCTSFKIFHCAVPDTGEQQRIPS